jgi:hypothetical protein
MAESFGCIAHSIPAIFEANEIEVRASMKLVDVQNGPVGLMVRIDGLSEVVGFENMKGKNIQGTIDWTVFSVKIPYPENAKVINIGALLWGSGQLWVDDFQVLLDGKDIREAAVKDPKKSKADEDHEFDNGSRIASIDLSGPVIEHLDVLGKVWGYLKYYHPRVTAGEYNWDYELFRILPKILGAKTLKQRNEVLSKWIAALGKFEETDVALSPDKEVKMFPDLSWIDAKTLGKDLALTLNKIKKAKRVEESYYFSTVSAVGNPKFHNEKAYTNMDYSDTGFKLLALYRYWNMIQYHFPYKYLIGEDWKKVLPEYIPRFINVKEAIEYRLTLLSIIARIHDTHANIRPDLILNDYKGQKFAPLQIAFIEGKAVVKGYFDKLLGEKSGLKIGDVIEAIDEKSVEDIIKEKLPTTPASNCPTQLRDISRTLLRTPKTEIEITYWNGTERLTKKVETSYPYYFSNYEMRPRVDTCFRMINSHIAYLYPGEIRNEYLPRIMEEVQKTKGLIIDFRCYPAEPIMYSLGAYLLPKAKPFVRYARNSITTPGLFIMSNTTSVGHSNPDYYKGKVVIMINEATQSQAEFTTMAFRQAPNATVLGSTTAAADGDISTLILPGGVETAISGIGIYYPDGKETQRIGIVPDIEVKPTIKGIREGRDELLEKAIEIIGKD